MCQLHLNLYKSLGPILSFDQMYLYFIFCICTCLTSSFSKYASGRAVVGGAGGPDTIPHISPHTCTHYHQHSDFAHITTNTLTCPPCHQHFDFVHITSNTLLNASPCELSPFSIQSHASIFQWPPKKMQ